MEKRGYFTNHDIAHVSPVDNKFVKFTSYCIQRALGCVMIVFFNFLEKTTPTECVPTFDIDDGITKHLSAYGTQQVGIGFLHKLGCL